MSISLPKKHHMLAVSFENLSVFTLFQMTEIKKVDAHLHQNTSNPRGVGRMLGVSAS